MSTNQASLLTRASKRSAFLAQKSFSKLNGSSSSYSSVSLGSTSLSASSGFSQTALASSFPAITSALGKHTASAQVSSALEKLSASAQVSSALKKHPASAQVSFPTRMYEKLCGCGCLEAVLSLKPHTCNSPLHDESTTRDLHAAWCKEGVKNVL